jgi:hypothetical protein
MTVREEHGPEACLVECRNGPASVLETVLIPERLEVGAWHGGARAGTPSSRAGSLETGNRVVVERVRWEVCHRRRPYAAGANAVASLLL